MNLLYEATPYIVGAILGFVFAIALEMRKARNWRKRNGFADKLDY